MIYTEAPADFSSEFEVTSLFMEHQDDILLLLRQDHKAQGNSWGVPAGKRKPNETIIQAIQRETEEETGVVLAEDDLTYVNKLYVRYPDYDFIYHMYRTNLTGNRPDIVINPGEHKEFRWVKPKDALMLDFIPDLDACIEMVYGLQ